MTDWKYNEEIERQIDDGGPAFPTNTNSPGMSLRDLFAGLAVIACATRGSSVEWAFSHAYQLADSALAERVK